MNKNNIILEDGVLLKITAKDLFSVHRRLLYLAFLLFVAHCTAMVFKYGFGNDVLFGLVPLFDFYEEKNIPTYFSSLSLLFSACLIFLIVNLNKSVKTSILSAWKVLGWGFLFMSIDEFADVRMIFKDIGRFFSNDNVLGISSIGFSVPWTIPMAIFVIFLGIYFLPFLSSLKKVYAINFAIAGAAFVFAAIGLENVQGFHVAENGGLRDFKFMIMVTIEETIEISSILYFQYFLIRYIRENKREGATLVIKESHLLRGRPRP